jgi:hypothetical protein
MEKVTKGTATILLETMVALAALQIILQDVVLVLWMNVKKMETVTKVFNVPELHAVLF